MKIVNVVNRTLKNIIILKRKRKQTEKGLKNSHILSIYAMLYSQ